MFLNQTWPLVLSQQSTSLSWVGGHHANAYSTVFCDEADHLVKHVSFLVHVDCKIGFIRIYVQPLRIFQGFRGL